MPLDRVEAIPFDIATRVRSSRVLDLVQIRAGTLAVEQRAEDLEGIVREGFEMLRPLAFRLDLKLDGLWEYLSSRRGRARSRFSRPERPFPLAPALPPAGVGTRRDVVAHQGRQGAVAGADQP